MNRVTLDLDNGTGWVVGGSKAQKYNSCKTPYLLISLSLTSSLILIWFFIICYRLLLTLQIVIFTSFRFRTSTQINCLLLFPPLPFYSTFLILFLFFPCIFLSSPFFLVQHIESVLSRLADSSSPTLTTEPLTLALKNWRRDNTRQDRTGQQSKGGEKAVKEGGDLKNTEHPWYLYKNILLWYFLI